MLCLFTAWAVDALAVLASLPISILPTSSTVITYCRTPGPQLLSFLLITSFQHGHLPVLDPGSWILVRPVRLPACLAACSSAPPTLRATPPRPIHSHALPLPRSPTRPPASHFLFSIFYSTLLCTTRLARPDASILSCFSSSALHSFACCPWLQVLIPPFIDLLFIHHSAFESTIRHSHLHLPVLVRSTRSRARSHSIAFARTAARSVPQGKLWSTVSRPTATTVRFVALCRSSPSSTSHAPLLCRQSPRLLPLAAAAPDPFIYLAADLMRHLLRHPS